MRHKKKPRVNKQKINIPAIVLIAVLAAIGVYTLTLSRAASPYENVEASSGSLGSGATVVTDPSASDGQAVDFNGGSPSNTCTDPVWHSTASDTTDAIGSGDLWFVNDDAWSGSAGPQTIYACNYDSWYTVSNQPNDGGEVQTYPDTEYDVGGRGNNTTKTIAQFNTISSTFSENYPSAGGWDAAYDLWTNDWGNETMIWNQWAGAQSYWPGQATIAVTLDGVPYKFLANGKELMFFRDTQVTSGSVNILAAWQWEVANGYAKSTDVPTQLEYGVEVCYTTGDETFPMNGLTFTVN